MDVRKTIENIRASCDNYVDPNLLAFIIRDDYLMGTNNIMDLKGYNDDDYTERLFEISKNENIFIPVAMVTFMPIINECDIFSDEDYNLKLTPEEFDTYADEEEKLVGILIKKDSSDYIIGKTDVCNCSIDASFKEFEKSDDEFYRTVEKIVNKKIID